ncbi:hypothetical protein DSQ19_05845 [Candidatus Nitrosotenuis sp. DW1]|nr:hypothetical protein DSQ19_05845 [Candidatus Nitrosotenuis sp. DW1]
MFLLIPSSYGDTAIPDVQVAENDIKGSNVSGKVTIPEKDSKVPFDVFSTAGGKSTQIKNNDVVVLPNKDMRIKISGYVEGALRGDKIDILILRPDDSVYTTGAYLNERGIFTIPAKMHTKWVEGCYEILANYIGNDAGKVKFFVTDKESVTHEVDSKTCNDALSNIFKYLHDKTTAEELTSHLREIGWSENRIDSFLAKHPVHVVDYTPFLPPAIVGLLALLYILTSYLSKEKTKLKNGAYLGSGLGI